MIHSDTKRIFCLILLAGSLLAGTSSVLGATIPVNAEGTGYYPTIQAAIDASSNSDIIELADGTYTGEGNKNLDYGGKSITVKSASGDPKLCVIDCQGNGRGFCFQSGEASDSVVDGLTILNGHADARTPGGNLGGYGGGIHCELSSPTITHCIFNGNSSSSQGGGMYNSLSDPVVTNCVFINNYSYNSGGGMYNFHSSPTVVNCLFHGNLAGRQGGGIFSCPYSSGTVTNCIMWGDSPEEICSYSSSRPDVTYSLVQGSYSWFGIGCIDTDPLFVFDNDYYLSSDSPCIDAGTNAPSVSLPAVDIDGCLRVVDGNGDSVATADMGVYEYDPEIPRIVVHQPYYVFQDPEDNFGQQQVVISNAGGTGLDWEISGFPTWLTASPYTAQLNPGEQMPITLTADSSGLSPGRYVAELEISDPQACNSPKTIVVSLYLSSVLSVPGEYPTIQAAIDAAVPMDVIELANGIYTGEGNKNLDYGGKSITVRSASGDPSLCIIDCEDDGRGFFFHSGETSDSIVNGLTITNGRNDPIMNGIQGGGLLCDRANPTIINCIISNNTTTGNGGGMYNYYSNPTIMNCQFLGNKARYGGGMYNTGSSPSVLNTFFCNNTAFNNGGGMYIHYRSNPLLINCVFRSNSAGNNSGGLICDGANCTIINCIMWGDSPNEIYCSSSLKPDVTFSLVQGGTGESWFGTGCLDVDPLFAFENDYHLSAGSPCIDAGNNEPSAPLPSMDIDGCLRVVDGNGDSTATVDMGVHEYDPATTRIALGQRHFEFIIFGEDVQEQEMFIGNAGGLILDWDVNGQPSWLDVSPSSGQLQPGEQEQVVLSADTTNMSPGCYSAELEFVGLQALNTPLHVSVVLRVGTALPVPQVYSTIREAIDAAGPGDAVILADGTYTGAGNKNLDFERKAITVRSASGDPSLCIIDCEGNGRGVHFHSGEGADSVLEGLTICNGYIFNPGVSEGAYGGGILCENSSPTLNHCVIRDNIVAADYASGGGMYIDNMSNPILDDCIIRSNRVSGVGVSSGAGIACRSSNPTFRNCEFSANVGSGKWFSGGGLCIVDGGPLCENCIFKENTVSGGLADGAGICINRSGSTLLNCVFAGNAAYTTFEDCSLCGVVSVFRCNPVITNCVLWGNTPSEFYVDDDSSPAVTYSLVQNGAGEEWFGAGCIDTDPLFAFDADVHLMPGSPCIDAGTNAPSVSLPAEDVEGKPRILDGNGDSNAVVDMGIYEVDPSAPSIAVGSTHVVFNTLLGQSSPDTQEMEIRNSAAGTLSWTITGMPSWLTVSPDNGVSSGEVAVVSLDVDASELTYGQYVALLKVEDSQAVNSPVFVEVTVLVADVLHVPGEFSTIQDAIDAAMIPGDIVEVADGTYAGIGNRDLRFKGKAITVKSASGDPELCIIDCQQQGRGFTFTSGEQASSVIEGLTICNGLPAQEPYHGGGVLCSESSPKISNCVFRNNNADRYPGGGIYLYSNASPVIVNCTFEGNTAGRGGGMWMYCLCSPEVTNCTFIGNRSLEGGAGLYVEEECCPTITNCRFLDNITQGAGGGMWVCAVSSPELISCSFMGNTASVCGGLLIRDYSDPVVTNCMFVGNQATVNGGAMGVVNWSKPVIRNSTFCDNAALSDHAPAGGLLFYGNEIEITNCIFWNNSHKQIITLGNDPVVTYSLIQDGSTRPWFGTGCIDTAPMFVDADGPDDDPATWEDNDYRLLPGSPGLDAGDNDAAVGVLTDLAGRPRFADDPDTPDTGHGTAPIIDMGAYETSFHILQVPADYTTIQAAIDASSNGDIVELADGTYTGEGNKNLDYGGKAITVKSASGDPGLCLIDCEGDGRGFYFHSGEGKDSILEGVTITNGYVMPPAEFGHGGGVLCDQSSPTIANCVFNNNEADYGGGLYVEDSANPVLTECRFADNHSDSEGGGLYCSGQSEVLLSHCDFVGNTARQGGGGISMYYSTLSIHACSFIENHATDVLMPTRGGGAILVANGSEQLGSLNIVASIFENNSTTGSYASGGAVKIRFLESCEMVNCIFSGNACANSGYAEGGAVMSEAVGTFAISDCIFKGNRVESSNTTANSGGVKIMCGVAVLTNCVITDNSVSAPDIASAGGIMLFLADSTLRNCTICNNIVLGSSTQGGGLCSYNSQSSILTNCILAGNDPVNLIYQNEEESPVVTYSLIQNGSGESWFGTGCIDTAPMFVDADGPDDDPATWEDNDYRLAPGSPGIDAGNNDVAVGMQTDLDGNPRFVDDPATADTGNGEAPVIDMGAFEYPGESFPGDLNGDDVVDLVDYGLFAGCLAGPNVTTPPVGVDPELFGKADLDRDGDVDLKDFSLFQRAFHTTD